MSLGPSNRSQVKLIVSLLPGIHLRRLQKMLGVSFTTTRYHVESLERDGEIVRSRDGRYDRLYPVGTAEGMKPIYAVLQSKNMRRLLEVLGESGPSRLTNGDLAARVHAARSTTSECLSHLIDLQLVRRFSTPEGSVVFEIQDRDALLDILASFKRSALEVAADGFIDLWDL